MSENIREQYEDHVGINRMHLKRDAFITFSFQVRKNRIAAVDVFNDSL